MKKHLLFLAVICIASVSCSKLDTIKPNQNISVNENATYEFKYDSKSVSFKVVEIQDSRCPSNADCVRAGEVIATFDVTVDGENFPNQQLCIQCEKPFEIAQEAAINGFTVKLMEVSPFPTTDNGNQTKTVVFQMK